MTTDRESARTLSPAALLQWPIAIVFLLELLFVLLMIRAPGTGDVQSFWMRWAANLDAHGLVAGYRINAADYPPLTSVILFAVTSLARVFSAPVFLAFKISLVVALFLSTAIFWRWTRNAALTGLLAVTLCINGIALGYLDGYFAPTLILSLWALQDRRIALFSATFAISCLIKWQPLVILPFLLLHARARNASESPLDSPKRLLALFGPPTAIIALCVLVFGFDPINSSLNKALHHSYLSGNALNLNWIVTYFLHLFQPGQYGPLVDGTVQFVVVNPLLRWVRLIKAVFLFFYLAALWRMFQRRTSYVAAIECSLVGYLAYFTLNIGVHENHLFLASILALAAAAISQEMRLRAILIVCITNLNLLIFYGLDGTGLGFSRVIGIDVSVILAIVNVFVFLAIWWRVLFPKLREPAASLT